MSKKWVPLVIDPRVKKFSEFGPYIYTILFNKLFKWYGESSFSKINLQKTWALIGVGPSSDPNIKLAGLAMGLKVRARPRDSLCLCQAQTKAYVGLAKSGT